DTSARTKCIVPPAAFTSSARARPRSSRRAPPTTVAPRHASSTAIARPSPEDAPVTTATLFSSIRSSSLPSIATSRSTPRAGSRGSLLLSLVESLEVGFALGDAQGVLDPGEHRVVAEQHEQLDELRRLELGGECLPGRLREPGAGEKLVDGAHDGRVGG